MRSRGRSSQRLSKTRGRRRALARVFGPIESLTRYGTIDFRATPRTALWIGGETKAGGARPRSSGEDVDVE